jgi:hypothetical protein
MSQIRIRPITAVDRVMDDFLDTYAVLNPIAATDFGLPGQEERLPDLSPDGLAEISTLRRVGERFWLRLRDDVRAREGGAFDLKSFHHKALAVGSVGLDALRSALLGGSLNDRGRAGDSADGS